LEILGDKFLLCRNIRKQRVIVPGKSDLGTLAQRSQSDHDVISRVQLQDAILHHFIFCHRLAAVPELFRVLQDNNGIDRIPLLFREPEQ
jgi:hypothetical protein